MPHTRFRLRALTATAIALVASAIGAAAASAGEFAVQSCRATASYSTQAFSADLTKGMKVRRACDPEGPGMRGLIVQNKVQLGRLKRGRFAAVELDAPEGTRFARFTWSGEARRRDCGFALQVYAEGPGIAPVPIVNVRPGQHCPRPGSAQASGDPQPRTRDVTGATRIVQRIICSGAGTRRSCSAKGRNYLRTFKAAAVVVDVSPPAVQITGAPLAAGQWVRGEQSIQYDASDNVGVRAARLATSSSAIVNQPRPCDYAARVPCPSGPGTMTVNTTQLADGTQSLVVQAEDAAGNVGASAPVTARVDNTPPGAVQAAVEGGEGWRNTNSYAVSWSNPPEGDQAPIARAHYALCRAGTSECSSDERAGEGIARIGDLTVPAPGEWSLRVWREDAAGNAQQANASPAVTLRYDPEPPQLGFEAPAAIDPTRLSVLVTDTVSGLGGGQIEISRQGSDSWQALSTLQEGTRLTTRIDDASLPPGVYLLRARAHDQAGNEASSDRRLDGQPMVVTLPLRVGSAMSAGAERERTLRRVVKKGSRKVTVPKRVVELRPRMRVGLGREVRIAGRLKSRDGQPLAGQPLSVFSRTPSEPERLMAELRTDGKGHFSYRARGSSTQVLRIAYAGTALILPAQREVTLLVPARSTLSVSRRSARNGQKVRFSGRIRALPVPAGGKLVEVQAGVASGWQTFRTARTDSRGRWSVSYRFQRTRGLVRYRFRARLPREATYPFEEGVSKQVSVLVRGT